MISIKMSVDELYNKILYEKKVFERTNQIKATLIYVSYESYLIIKDLLDNNRIFDMKVFVMDNMRKPFIISYL